MTEIVLLTLGIVYHPLGILAVVLGTIYAGALLYAGAEIALKHNWRYFFSFRV